MNTVHRRSISFAGSSVAVEYRGPQAAAVVDLLYRHAPSCDGPPPCATYRLAPDEKPGQLRLYRDDRLIYTQDEGAVAELLLSDSCRQLASNSCGGLLFHAAGLARQGMGILVPGRVGAGKTTLAAWLTLQGLDYLTDELTFIPHGTEILHAFTRPLNLKHPSRAVLQNAFDFEANAAAMSHSPSSYLVPPELLKPDNAPSKPALGLILFPHFTPVGDFALMPLSKAQAGLALMQCLVNTDNLPGHGFSEIARLCRAVPAYHLSYTSFDQLRGPLKSLITHR